MYEVRVGGARGIDEVRVGGACGPAVYEVRVGGACGPAVYEVRVGGACGPPPPVAAPLRCALLPAATPPLNVHVDGAVTSKSHAAGRYAPHVTDALPAEGSNNRAVLGSRTRRRRTLSGGSPREGARSEAEQRLAAGGRRLPRPGLRTNPGRRLARPGLR